MTLNCLYLMISAFSGCRLSCLKNISSTLLWYTKLSRKCIISKITKKFVSSVQLFIVCVNEAGAPCAIYLGIGLTSEYSLSLSVPGSRAIIFLFEDVTHSFMATFRTALVSFRGQMRLYCCLHSIVQSRSPLRFHCGSQIERWQTLSWGSTYMTFAPR